MLKIYKNAFYEEIIKANINPLLFEAKEEKVTNKSIFENSETPFLAFKILLKETPLEYTISGGNTYSATSTFSYAIRFNPYLFSADISFEDLLENFRKWLNTKVKFYLEELNTPDFWADSNTYKSFVGTSKITEQSKENFSDDEKENLLKSIERFKLLVEENFQPNKEQTEFICEQLDYLSEAVVRLNRFDWRGLAISVILGIGINLSVDTEKGRFLWNLADQAFHSAVKFLQ